MRLRTFVLIAGIGGYRQGKFEALLGIGLPVDPERDLAHPDKRFDLQATVTDVPS